MMEDRREAGYVITNGNPTGTESKTENKTENKMGNVNGSGIVMGTPADLEVSGIKFHYGKRNRFPGQTWGSMSALRRQWSRKDHLIKMHQRSFKSF